MRRIASLARILLLFACLAAAVARAEDARVLSASLRAVEEGLVLDADFALDLSPRLVEALMNGVPLYFVVEFELGRHRWYWFDEKSASRKMQLRLSYHALSRQFRLFDGTVEQNFPTLAEAMDMLRHVRNWLVVDRTVSFSDADYEAGVRMRLDTALLPKPFQLSALTDPELRLETRWRRFVVQSPKQLPAPVETRQPEAVERP